MPTGNPDIVYVGVDPGASGGLAYIHGKEVVAVKTPKTEIEIWRRFRDLKKKYPYLKFRTLIEWINPGYKGSNKSGVAKLYGSYKALRMALVASEITDGLGPETVMPVKWQRYFGIPSRQGCTDTVHKNRIKDVAISLFPQKTITLATCDALLIAEYAKRTDGG